MSPQSKFGHIVMEELRIQTGDGKVSQRSSSVRSCCITPEPEGQKEEAVLPGSGAHSAKMEPWWTCLVGAEEAATVQTLLKAQCDKERPWLLPSFSPLASHGDLPWVDPSQKPADPGA